VNLKALERKFKNTYEYLASSPNKFSKNGFISSDIYNSGVISFY
jgi:hypothetical protein